MEIREQISQFKDMLMGSYKPKLAYNRMKGRHYLEIDFVDIIKHEPDLGNLLLDNPKDTIKAIQLAVEDIDEDYKGYQIMIYNLGFSTNMPLNQIRNQFNKFLTFEGHIVKPSEFLVKTHRATFECQECRTETNILMDAEVWKEPRICIGCGKKGGFLLKYEDQINYQIVELLEALNYEPEENQKLTKKKVMLSGELIRPELSKKIQPGKKVKIHGWLSQERIKSGLIKSNKFRTTIIANNIIPIEQSWDAIKLSDKQIIKIKEMAKKKDLLDSFSQSLAPSFEGYVLVRQSLILQHLGGKRIVDTNGNLEERETIHVLMCGSPGTGKSYLQKKSLSISPLGVWTQGAGTTKVGLVAAVTRDETGQFALEVGPFVMADKGMLGIDEMDKMAKEDYGMLNNGMNDEQTKITKANIDQLLKTRTSILATSNPFHRKFVDSETIIKQLAPIPKDILDRFDVIWAMREEINTTKLEDKYMARHLGSEKIEPEYSNIEIRNYIAYARRLKPIPTQEIVKYFNNKFKKLTGKTTEDSEQSHRLRGNIMRWIYAYSKFIGVGKENKKKEIEVTKESVKYAFNLIRNSFNMLGLLNKEGFASFEAVENIPTKREVSKYYIIKELITKMNNNYKGMIPIEDLLKESKMDEDEFEEVLEKLKRSGEIYEPRRGFISLQ